MHACVGMVAVKLSTPPPLLGNTATMFTCGGLPSFSESSLLSSGLSGRQSSGWDETSSATNHFTLAQMLQRCWLDWHPEDLCLYSSEGRWLSLTLLCSIVQGLFLKRDSWGFVVMRWIEVAMTTARTTIVYSITCMPMFTCVYGKVKEKGGHAWMASVKVNTEQMWTLRTNLRKDEILDDWWLVIISSSGPRHHCTSFSSLSVSRGARAASIYPPFNHHIPNKPPLSPKK